MQTQIVAKSNHTDESYLIGDRIGKGSFGYVFECKKVGDTSGQSLVIKVTQSKGLD